MRIYIYVYMSIYGYMRIYIYAYIRIYIRTRGPMTHRAKCYHRGHV